MLFQNVEKIRSRAHNIQKLWLKYENQIVHSINTHIIYFASFHWRSRCDKWSKRLIFFFCVCWMRIARYAETELCIIEYRNNVDRNHKSFEHAFIDNDSRVDDDRTSDHAIISYSITKRYYYSSSFFVFNVVRRCEWYFDCVNSLIIAIDSSNFQKTTTSNYSFFARWKCAKSKLWQTKMTSKNDLFVIQTFFRIKNFSNEMFRRRINCFISKKNADNHMQKNCDQNSCSIKNEIVFNQNVDLKQKRRCDNRSKKKHINFVLCAKWKWKQKSILKKIQYSSAYIE